MPNPVRDLESLNGFCNEVRLFWRAPIGMRSTQLGDADDDNTIIIRRKDQFPVEIQNDDSTYTPRHYSGTGHVSGFTDYNQVEVFNSRGRLPTGNASATSSAGQITDTGNFTGMDLTGQICRDANSYNYRILSNTNDTLTLDTTDTPTILTAVPASGSITTIAKANISDGETFTIDDGVNSYVFEFDTVPDGVSGTNIVVDISADVTADNVRDTIIAAINGSAIQITAINNGSASILLVNDNVGAHGNTTSSDTVSDANFIVSNMTGGISNIYTILPDFPKDDFSAFTSTEGSLSNSGRYGLITDLSDDFKDLDIGVDDLRDSIITVEGAYYIVVSNTVSTITVHMPFPYAVLGSSKTYSIKQRFAQTGNQSLAFIDNYLNLTEAAAKSGTGLEDDQYYYYTVFTNGDLNTDFEAVFRNYDLPDPTMVIGLSCKDRNFGDTLYNYWPEYNREYDTNNYLENTVDSLAAGLNEAYSHIVNFKPYDPKKIRGTALPYYHKQYGLEELSTEIGLGAFRRLGERLVSINKLKGSKEGLYELIRNITEWDITGGEGLDGIDTAIDDGQKIIYFRFWSDIWPENARMFGFQTAYDNNGALSYGYTAGDGVVTFSAAPDLSSVQPGYIFVAGDGSWNPILDVGPSTGPTPLTSSEIRIDAGLSGIADAAPSGDSGDILSKTPLENSARFLDTQIGVVVPGIFSTRLMTIRVPDIALFEGESTGMTTTTLTDSSASWPVNGLIGAYILPKESEPSNVYKITANTATTVTIEGTFTNTDNVGDYAILSPLNTKRLLQINETIQKYIASFATVIFDFDNS